MADDEKIGGVSIDVKGDYSSLASDLAAAEAIAKQAGDKIAAAMNSGVMAASDFDAEFKKLVDSGKSINEAMGLLSQQFASVGSSATTAAGGIGQAGTAVNQLTQNLNQALPAGQQLTLSVDHITEALLKFTGIVGGIHSFSELAKDALEAAGRVQEATIALTRFTGDAETAKSTIEGLGQLAVSDALSFPSLLTAEQRFLEFDVSVQAVPGLLMAAADAAAATNRSFDQVANSLERMVDSGMASSRSLVQIGLSMKDLADVLGVASEDVKNAFKDLDPTQRAQALTEALGKVSGLASETAQTITGQWRSLSAEFHIALESMGGALAPFASELISWAKDIVWALGTVSSAASSTFEFLSRNLNSSLGRGVGGSGEVANNNNLSLQGGALPGGRPGDFGGETNLPADTSAIDSNTKAIVAHNQAVRDAADAAKAMTDEYLKFDSAVRPLWEKLPQNYQDYLDKLTQGGQTAASMLKTITADIDKAISVSADMSGHRLDQMNQWVAALQSAQEKIKAFADSDAFYKAAQQIQLLTDKFPEQVKELAASDAALKTFFETMKNGAANVPDALNKFSIVDLTKQAVEAQKQLDDSTKKLGDSFEKAWAKFEIGTHKAVDTVHEFTYTVQQDEVDWEKAWGALPVALQNSYGEALKFNDALKGLGMTAEASGEVVTKGIAKFNELAQNSFTTLPLLELGWARISTIVAKLGKEDLPLAIAEYNKMLEAAQRLAAPLGDQLKVQEQLLSAEIAYASRSGADATKQIEVLDSVRRAQQTLIDHSQLLGKAYVGLMADFDHAFSNLGKTIADNIIVAKDWGKAFMAVIETLEKEILNTLIGTVFKQLDDVLTKQGGLLSNLAHTITDALGKVTGLGTAGASQIGAAAQTTALTSNTTALAANTAAILGDTAATTADTAATTAAAVAEGAQTVATTAETATIGADIVAEALNTTATITETAADFANTAATAIETATTAADIVAEGLNTVAVTADTAAEVADTAAEIGDTAAEVANTAAVVADTAATTAAASASVASGALGAAGGLAGAASGGVVGIASLGVQIAAGISNGLQNARMINLLGEIEISTRKTQAQLIEGIQPSLNIWLPELAHLVDIWREVMRTNELLTILRDAGGKQYPDAPQQVDTPVTSQDQSPPPSDTGPSTGHTPSRPGSSGGHTLTTALRGGRIPLSGPPSGPLETDIGSVDSVTPANTTPIRTGQRLPIYDHGGLLMGWQLTDPNSNVNINSLGEAAVIAQNFPSRDLRGVPDMGGSLPGQFKPADTATQLASLNAADLAAALRSFTQAITIKPGTSPAATYGDTVTSGQGIDFGAMMQPVSGSSPAFSTVLTPSQMAQQAYGRPLQGGENRITVNAVDPTARSVAQGIIYAMNERGFRTN